MEDAFQKVVSDNMGHCIFCDANKWQLFTCRNSFKLFRCGNCSYTKVWPTPPNLGAIYNNDYFKGAHDGFGYADYDRDKEAMQGTFQRSLEVLRSYVGPGKKKLLDIGAATGYFVRLAKQSHFVTEGVEISDYAANIGRARGLEIVTGTIESLAPGQFDVITLWDVLEHVRDPLVTIQSVSEHLSVGGVLLVNTPDIGSFYARMMGRYWHHLIPPEHIHFYTRAGLSNLLRERGFEIISVGVPGKWFSLPYVLNIMSNWTGWLIFRYMSGLCTKTFLARVSLPLNLRDNFILYARKVR